MKLAALGRPGAPACPAAQRSKVLVSGPVRRVRVPANDRPPKHFDGPGSVAADVLATAIGMADAGQRREADRRQRSAQQSFLQATRALATCRKLLKPAPSPLDLLRPVAETAAGSNRLRGAVARPAAG